MKKSTKIFAAAMAVIPCACMLTACGAKDDGLKREVNVAGNYSVSSYEEVSNELDLSGNNATATTLDSYRSRMAIEIKGTLDDISTESKIESNLYAMNVSNLGAETTENPFYLISTYKEEYKTNIPGEDAYSTENNLYMSGDNLYTEYVYNDETERSSQTIPSGMHEFMLQMQGINTDTSSSTDMTSLFEGLQSATNEQITVMVESTNSMYKVHMVIAPSFFSADFASILEGMGLSVEMNNIDIYYLFDKTDNGLTLNAMSLEVSFEGSFSPILENFPGTAAGTLEGKIVVEVSKAASAPALPNFENWDTVAE